MLIQAARGLIPPFLLAGTLMLLLGRRRGGRGEWPPFVAGLVYPIGLLGGSILLQGFPPLPPVSASHRLALAAIPLAFLGPLWKDLENHRGRAWLLGGAAALLCGLYPVWISFARSPWLPSETDPGSLILLALPMLAGAAASTPVRERSKGARGESLVLVLHATTAAVLAATGSMLYGQIAGTLAVVSTISLFAALTNRPRLLGASSLPQGAILGIGLCLAGLAYSEVTTTEAILLCLSWALTPLALGESRPLSWTFLSAGPAMAALVLSIQSLLSDSNPYGY